MAKKQATKVTVEEIISLAEEGRNFLDRDVVELFNEAGFKIMNEASKRSREVRLAIRRARQQIDLAALAPGESKFD